MRIPRLDTLLRLLGLVLLGVVAALGFIALRRESPDLGLVALAVGIVALAALGLGWTRWEGEPDPLRRRREQRLWRSGPLGRAWLRVRQRYSAPGRAPEVLEEES